MTTRLMRLLLAAMLLVLGGCATGQARSYFQPLGKEYGQMCTDGVDSHGELVQVCKMFPKEPK